MPTSILRSAKKIDIPPFDGGDGFFLWHQQFVCIAIQYDLMPADLTRTPTLSAAKSRQLSALLASALKGHAASILSRATPGDGNKAWEELMNEYAPNSGAHTQKLINKLNTIQPKDQTARAVYHMVSNIDEIIGEVRLCGLDVNMCEQLASARVCTILPAHYASIIDRATQGAPWAEVSKDIKRMSSNLSASEPATQSASTAAAATVPSISATSASVYAASTRFHPYQQQGGPRKQEGSRPMSSSYSWMKTCYYCGERGHVMMNCQKFKQHIGRQQRQQSSKEDKEASFADQGEDLYTMENTPTTRYDPLNDQY